MNTLKTLFAVAALAGSAYAVYLTVTAQPPGPPPEFHEHDVTAEVGGAPAVEFGNPVESGAVAGLQNLSPVEPSTLTSTGSIGMSPPTQVPQVSDAAPPFAGRPPLGNSPSPTPAAAPRLPMADLTAGNPDSQPERNPAIDPFPSRYPQSPNLAAGAPAASDTSASPEPSRPRLPEIPFQPTVSDSPPSRYGAPGNGYEIARIEPPRGSFGDPEAGSESPAGNATGERAPPAYPDLTGSVPDPFSSPTAVPGSLDEPVGVQPGHDRDPAEYYARALAKLDQREFAEALRVLSQAYGWNGAEDQPEVLELLDQLAGTVIYSQEHLLAPPHVVQPGETLETIAASYDVPWQLLAKINGLPESEQVAPGQTLKVLRGQFEAVVDLNKFVLALRVDGMYAGRFEIGLGRDQQPPTGDLVIQAKWLNPTYWNPQGAVDKEDPDNPLGEHWLDLGGHFGIHGMHADGTLSRYEGRGYIRLKPRDAADLFTILSVGSKVKIVGKPNSPANDVEALRLSPPTRPIPR